MYCIKQVVLSKVISDGDIRIMKGPKVITVLGWQSEGCSEDFIAFGGTNFGL